MLRKLAFIAAASFVVAAICFAGAAALAAPTLSKPGFWREFEAHIDGPWNDGEHGDPNAPTITQARAITGFTDLDVSGGLSTQVAIGPEFKVEVVSSEPDSIITELNGTELSIHRRSHSGWHFSTDDAEVRVTMPALKSASSSAGSDIEITGLTGGDLALDASSGSSLDVSGTCASLDVKASSGADVDAGDLTCASGGAEASSGGSVKVNVTGELNIDASSGGSINAVGNPQMGQISLSSGGSLDRE